jgi:putative transposase
MIELMDRLQEKKANPSIRGMCRALSLSRATLYRSGSAIDSVEYDTDMHGAMQQIAVDMPCYGYRRITKELHRQGYKVNHKRVLHLMRQDNLLCLRKRKFVVTTDSGHDRRIYPNLARDLAVSSINQLWVADITYIRLHREFVYLAVILDAYSRRCIGWNLGRRLNDILVIDALKMTLGSRPITSGLVHHSDRGVQYASAEYTRLLTEHHITISMSRKGNPYDNAYAESFMKTLKYEEVYLSEYESLADAKESIEHFLKEVYNIKRLHSSIGYMPPVEFEQQILEQELTLSLN